MSRPSGHRSGFTLIEMLLVVFILAAVAATAASLTSQVDEQFRYDDTKARREQLRQAILGDPARTMNGQPVVSGFVADTGGLPSSLRQLIELDPPASPTWSFFPTQNQWAGWRGPYLHGVEGKDPYAPATRRLYYRDGWANVASSEDYAAVSADHALADRLNSGWLWGSPADAWYWDGSTEVVPAGELWLRSPGADGRVGDGGPLGADTPTDRVFARTVDHRVDVTGWRVRVRLTNTSGSTPTTAIPALRLRIWTPTTAPNGFVTWELDGAAEWLAVTDRDEHALISHARTPGIIAAGATWSEEFVFEPLTSTDPRLVAWGRRSLDLIDDATGVRWNPITFGGTDALVAREVTFLPRAALPDLSTQPAFDVSLAP